MKQNILLHFFLFLMSFSFYEIGFAQNTTNVGVNQISAPSARCGLPASFQVRVRIRNFGTQAQSNFPVSYRVNLGTPVTQNFTGTLNPGDTFGLVFTTPFVAPAGGSYRFDAWTSLTLDQQMANDSTLNRIFFRSGNNLAKVSFTGFTGGNLTTVFPGWSEATGLNPTGITSGWLNSNAAQTTFLGSTTAKINLFSNTKKDWIISPPVVPFSNSVLKFKMALTDFSATGIDSMGSDDSVIVKLSTNCGVSWTNLRTYTRLNPPSHLLSGQLISLSAYAGQNIILGFYGSEGTVNDLNDYDVHVDDIEVMVPLANDLSASEIVNLPGICGPGFTAPLTIKVLNNGSSTQNSITAAYSLNGQTPVSQTFSQSIVPGASLNLTFSDPLNFPNQGTYNLSAWTNQAVDSNRANDTLKVVLTRRDTSFLPVNFTGFTGGNLTTLYPDWREATGLNATGTTSTWTASSVAQTNFLGSATARINLVGSIKKDWIISRPFIARPGSIVRFRLAVTDLGTGAADAMGSDDSLVVKVSTNCGTSWVRIYAVTAASAPTNSLSSHIASLTPFTGLPVLVGFFATEGVVNDINDYDLHIDDIEVLTPSPKDLALQTVLVPNQDCGVPSGFNLKVRVINSGTEVQNSIPLNYQLAALPPVNQVFSQTINPGQTLELTFATPVSLPNPGNYNLSVWTSLPGDANPANDSVKNVVLRRSGNGFNPVTFEGFTGGNLSTLFPGWSEATGLIPGGTTSAWLNSNATQTTFFGSTTAKINLFTGTKKDWILSQPVIPPPASVLKYRVALTNFSAITPDSMGSDDSLIVRVTTNCGQSWTNLKTYTRANQPNLNLTQEIVSLDGFSGQNIRIGFYGSEGAVDDLNDYDVHIDNVEVMTPTPKDLALQTVLVPAQDCGSPASFNLKVRVFNNGTEAQTSIPLNYQLAALPPVNQVFSQNINPGQSLELTFSAPVDLPNPGTYNLSAWTSLPADANIANDSVKNVILRRPGNGFNPVTFEGFTGANLSTLFAGWSEAIGLIPAGTTSGWLNSNATQTTFFGSTTAKINLFTGSKKDWIQSQPVVPLSNSFLKYKVALTNFAAITPDSMGSDDSLIVRVTTNCGQSWTNLKTYTRANPPNLNLTQESLSLGSFAGQAIRIGFYASEGSVDDLNDYDVHIDDVEVLVPSPNDLAMQSILLPDVACGASNPYSVRIRVLNNGTQPQSSFVLGYQISGQSPVEETFSQSLSAGSSSVFTFSVPASFSAPGNYQISAWTKLTGDANTQNDSIRNQSFVRPGPNFAPVNFTAFNGGNLGALFPGWREQAGLNPTGTFSSWTVSSAAQNTAFGSEAARVTMIAAAKREWMLSPPFSPESGQILKFKIAVTTASGVGIASMGTDDSLIVKASTNCGQSWVQVQAYTLASGLTNVLTEKAVPLGFAGQNVILAFYATEGTFDDLIDYDILIDDISLTVPPANDLSVQEIIFPSGNCGGPPSLNVKVRVSNFGSNAQSGFTLNYQVNNQPVVTETFTGTLTSGSSSVYTFAPTVSLDLPGDYFFSAWTNLSADAVIANDSVKNKKLTRPGEVLVQVDFNAYNGNNLSGLYEGWYEATGAGANPGNATWVNSTGSQTGTLGSQTARINMNSNTKRDWLVSAVVAPLPASNLKFKMAVTVRNFGLPATAGMGSDDSVNVMVSTNCGVSWTRLRAFTAASNLTNALQEFTVPLGAFAGQPIRIGFFATEGVIDDTQDFDFHLDDVYVSISTGNSGWAQAGGLSLFPNPAKGRFSIRLPEGSRPDRVSLFNMQGKNILLSPEFEQERGILTCDIPHLPTGIYKVRLDFGDKTETQTLSVE